MGMHVLGMSIILAIDSQAKDTPAVKSSLFSPMTTSSSYKEKDAQDTVVYDIMGYQVLQALKSS